jgi:hypothetical protein
MAGIQRLLAITVAFFLAGIPGSGKADALGIVVLADHANAGSQAAIEGTTVFDGDRLSTDAGGALRLQVGGDFVSLADQSSVMIHRGARGAEMEFEAELVSGGVTLSIAKGKGAEIVARSARIRSEAETRGVVQVRMVGRYELLVFAEGGAAEISYHGETETIAEGKSYRVLLRPDEDGASGDQSAKRPGKRGKALVVIAVATAVAAGIVLLSRSGNGGTTKSMESPDHP